MPLGLGNGHYSAIKFFFIYKGLTFQPGLVNIHRIDGEIQILGDFRRIVEAKTHQGKDADIHRHGPIFCQTYL